MLASIVATDIRQRAIPWSRLLLPVALVALLEIARYPLQQPLWLQRRPALRRFLVIGCLTGLALVALAVTANGLVQAWRHDFPDLHERLDKWRLFRDRIYPSGRLASPEQRALTQFRTSVYLPWALPLFRLMFAGGGALQGKLLIQALSLLSLGLLACLGWRSLRPWGRAAA